jgi:hypothetical protein
MVSARIVRDGSEIKLPGLFEVVDLNPSVFTTENLVGVVFTGDVLMFDDGTSSTYTVASVGRGRNLVDSTKIELVSYYNAPRTGG